MRVHARAHGHTHMYTHTHRCVQVQKCSQQFVQKKDGLEVEVNNTAPWGHVYVKKNSRRP